MLETLIAIAIAPVFHIAQIQPNFRPCPGKMLCRDGVRPNNPTYDPNHFPAGMAFPYPPGTPCGITLVKGVKTLVSPEGIPGAYCDERHTIQYKL